MATKSYLIWFSFAGICLIYASAAMAQNVPNGFAAVAGEGLSTTTGGGNATPTTVTTYSALSSALSGSTARVVILSGSVTTPSGGAALAIGSNKTLIGADKNATINGGIEIDGPNVIVRNLNIKGVGQTGADNSTNHVAAGPWDVVHIQGVGVHHVWIDHCSLSDAGDGILDITGQSSYVTVSWCKFYYTDSSNTHRLCALIGSGGGNHPEDWGYLKVTYHHNWFDALVNERMPRLMYGQSHVYNDYYTCTGNNYCIGCGSYGAALIENNYFKNVKNPHQFMYAVYCYITATNNIYNNCTGLKDNGLGGSGDASGQSFNVQPFTNPPYSYTLDSAANVPNLVTNGAGPQSSSTVPTGLTATAGNAQVSLSWTAASGATNYYVKRSTTSGNSYVTIATNSTTTYVNTGLVNGTTYYYVVSALSASGESTNSSQASATPQLILPATPLGLNATAGNTEVALSWNSVAGATAYILKSATVNGGPYTGIFTNATTSYVDTGLTNGTSYYYVVSATNAAGTSADSSQVSATPQASSPPASVAMDISSVVTGTSSAFSLPVTVSAGAKVLVVLLNGKSGSTYIPPASLMWNGQTLTNAVSVGAATVLYSSIYYLFNPPVGTGNATGTIGGSHLGWAGQSYTLTGVDTSVTPLTGGPGSGDNTHLSFSIANCPAGGLAAATAGWGATGIITITATSGTMTSTYSAEYPASYPNTMGYVTNISGGSETFTATVTGAGHGSKKAFAVAVFTPTSGAANTAPSLSLISDQVINVGANLFIDNDAIDYDLPAQTLTYSLPIAPVNAAMDTNSGILTWRPLVTQANTTNPFSVVVADNGSPSMSATQSFKVIVNPLTQPSITAPLLGAGQVGFTINGQAGPDYAVQSSSNLADWSTLFITNSPAMPFTWSTNTDASPMQFYRIKTGPPLP